MLRKGIVFLSLLILTSISPLPAYAQTGTWAASCIENGIASLRCLPDVFNNLVTAALEFAGSIAIILLIYAGIRLTTSGGDPKQTQAARQIATYAIIGLVVVLSSFAIIYLIGYLTGSTNCITDVSLLVKGGCQ